MSEMTTAKAQALRKEFPAKAVGKLPKPYKADSPRGNCNECGGWHGLPAVHLDYVGHAATTDRLLSVDPEWTWRPFTQDELLCLPPKLRDAGLWIHLTVCGVTRPGVGDGKSAKECIGDAIRNAAMRFGVALDLWAKEDLHDISAEQEAEPVAPAEVPEAYQTREHKVSAPMKPATRGALFALFTERGITDKAEQLRGINHIVARDEPLTSRGDLTEAEARMVIDVLKSHAAQDAPVAPEVQP